jgi:hypothetical protein
VVLLAAKERKKVHILWGLRIHRMAVVEAGVCSDQNWILSEAQAHPSLIYK